MNKLVPIKLFGKCPKCDGSSKIVWGWHGVYYDLICKNGHLWTFNFKRKQGRRRNNVSK